MTPITLKVYAGGKLTSSRVFKSDKIRLGSGAADLILESTSVAANHALIESGATGPVLRVVGNEQLYLNGQPVYAAPLRHGDLISIGDLRVMVELRTVAIAPAPPRPRLQLIQGEEGTGSLEGLHGHAPALAVVREEEPLVALADLYGPEEVAPALPPQPPVPMTFAPLAAPHNDAAPPRDLAAALQAPAVEAKPAPVAGARDLARLSLPPLPAGSVKGGECAEVELFWGDTRISVWQLEPGQEFLAGSADGCHALLPGLDKAPVLRSDASGWLLCAPRPLALSLEENGKALGGPELLVRGRSQADAHGLVVPLPARAVAILSSGALALRVRRVPSASRAGTEPTDWKGVLVASIAAMLMMFGMKMWSNAVPPPHPGSGEIEVIRPRPIVRSTAKPEPLAVKEKSTQKNQGRQDPGKAAARHLGEEGQAGSKTAPRRDARAERRMDDRALVADSGLLKALGGGKGASNVFGVALDKGTADAMGHLTGPRVGDAHGDGGMGLTSLGGRGGGGDGSGLGLARIGTNGIGGGLANYGDGKGGLRGKENGEIGLGPGQPQVYGRIDPELIRKVVHEHRAQIRTCYETQLTSRPDLAGKLVSAWTIDQSGAVTEAHTQESSLHDHTVETCVAAKIKTWRFPIPKGGGEVFVTYPFIFTPGG
jgi:hypothetical protein